MSRSFSSDLRDHSYKIPDPFPVNILKRRNHPTTKINKEEVKRVSERDGGFYRAGQGEFGPALKKEYKRFVVKHPLSGTLDSMTGARVLLLMLLISK